MAMPPRRTKSRISWALLLGAIIVFSGLGIPSAAEDPAWNDAMKAAQKAMQESRYSDAEQFLRTAVKEAEKFPPGDRRLDVSFSGLATVLYYLGKYD